MEDNKPKSGSAKLHEFLCDKPLGFRFTNSELVEAVGDWGFGEGVFSGFIVRAKKKGMIAAVAGKPNKDNRFAVVYELINHDGWKFHGPGIGSYAGREINAHKHDPIPPLVDLMLNSPAAETAPKPEEEIVDQVLMGHKTKSLTDQLMELVIQVNELENKKPSLSVFTTDEVLAELRSRVK
jgi:hypothetical protein